ncbi:hypothetical protein PRIEUP_LOCUS115, partial [Pristimantis euphronides]
RQASAALATGRRRTTEPAPSPGSPPAAPRAQVGGVPLATLTVKALQQFSSCSTGTSCLALTGRQVLLCVLIILSITPLVSESLYAQTGSEITDCNMKCPHKGCVIQIYKECGQNQTKLLEWWCDNTWSYHDPDPRLHYNTSGCWTLTDVRKYDSCVYNVNGFCNGKSQRLDLKTLNVTVLDPVLNLSITSNFSRLGQDIAVTVQFSGEETSLTWEVDRGPLPDRYWLIDDNRTLIILNAQRDDTERRLRVRVTNPISEETGEYQLKVTDSQTSRFRFVPGVAAVWIIIIAVIVVSYFWR